MLVLSSKPLLAARIRFLLWDVFFFGTAQRMEGAISSHTDLKPNAIAGNDTSEAGKRRAQSDLLVGASSAAIILLC